MVSDEFHFKFYSIIFILSLGLLYTNGDHCKSFLVKNFDNLQKSAYEYYLSFGQHNFEWRNARGTKTFTKTSIHTYIAVLKKKIHLRSSIPTFLSLSLFVFLSQEFEKHELCESICICPNLFDPPPSGKHTHFVHTPHIEFLSKLFLFCYPPTISI
jgi:hypothetical protein